MNDVTARSTATIRDASPSDAPKIYELKFASFGQSYLSYTIYRSPASAIYLAELLSKGRDHGHVLQIAEQDGVAVGYLQAHRSGTALFLSYIGVKQEVRNSGLGSALHEAFNSAAIDMGCDSLALDVFESNQRAVDWYRSLGYTENSRVHVVRINLKMLPEKADPIDVQNDLYRESCKQEDTQGFSKMPASFEGRPFEIGLINGNVLKLLSPVGDDLQALACALGSRFRNERDELIVSSSTTIPDSLPFLSSEISVRMHKGLR